MHEYVEKAFDNENFILLAVNANENLILLWKIQITNYAAVNTDIGQGKSSSQFQSSPQFEIFL